MNGIFTSTKWELTLTYQKDFHWITVKVFFLHQEDMLSTGIKLMEKCIFVQLLGRVLSHTPYQQHSKLILNRSGWQHLLNTLNIICKCKILDRFIMWSSYDRLWNLKHTSVSLQPPVKIQSRSQTAGGRRAVGESLIMSCEDPFLQIPCCITSHYTLADFPDFLHQFSIDNASTIAFCLLFYWWIFGARKLLFTIIIYLWIDLSFYF